MSGHRDESGKFTDRVRDEDILDALRSHPEPVATARELADTLPVTSETVRRRLSDLHDREVVGRKKVGARAVVWWVSQGPSREPAPAAPLQGLVGMLDEDDAARARERSRAWRDAFDREMAGDNGDGA